MKALAVAVEQRDPHGGLELPDARADVGRHAVQLVRGLDDAAFLDDGPEHLQVGEVHPGSPDAVAKSFQIENNSFSVIHYSGNKIQPMLLAMKFNCGAAK